ncbi:MAG: AmmeMemoRadiSam system radical SAM enzyme [Euryarchaeota archaeon]|nr:AmmeMemoRadiSam system radical SAM enzyme [Euryarchaeota archaeon]
MDEARFYEPLGGGRVRCNLCSHRCVIAEGKRGICGVRENRGGRLYTLVYGRAIAYHVDPIEKKPLFHFLPGTKSYSIATVGCNFRCLHCQNWEISQMPREGRGVSGIHLPPEEVVEQAQRHGCASISYTYTEPTIFAEYAVDCARLAGERGIKNVFVTNGYITEDALREVAPHLDAANIDLKGFTDEFYREVCGARLEPVLRSIRLYREMGVWVEVTTLIIPGHNDDEEQLRGIARFIRSVGREVPWHVTRFHPDYRLTEVPSTPLETLRRAMEIGREEGLLYVYMGNVPGEGEDTLCPGCGEVLIQRRGFEILKYRIREGRCPECGTEIHGVWEDPP